MIRYFDTKILSSNSKLVFGTHFYTNAGILRNMLKVLRLRTYPASKSRTRVPLTCFPTGRTLTTLLIDSVVI